MSIRRDYVMRQIQELVQVLSRAVFLRTQGECEAALKEIRRALKALDSNADVDALDVPGWIALCRQHEDIVGPLMEVVGSILRERALSLEASGETKQSELARVAGLTLHLEAILNGANPITAELLRQVDEDIRVVAVDTLPPATLSHLFAYCEQRGRLAAAEDILFDWLDTGDPNAAAAGRQFYARLTEMKDSILELGGLSHAEVEEGRDALEKRVKCTGSARVREGL